MKNIINWFLYKAGNKDWLKHLILGTLFFIAVLVVMEYFQEDRFLSFTIANFATLFLGAGKEIYDQLIKKKKGEARDIFYTCLGAWVLTLLTIIF
jgi:hypothetical protein